MTEAVVYMNNVQRLATRKSKGKRKKRKKKKRKTCNHMLSSVRDLVMIYIAGEFHEHDLKGFQNYAVNRML